jgi:uncharacterized SAM-binding protein YcdF (DUF218 family)
MFYLGKVFIQLSSPLGVCLWLMPLGALLLLLRRRKTAVFLLVGAFAWLLVWSLPVASVPLRRGLEQQFPQRPAGDYPTVDAIIVLGGGIQGGRTGWRSGPHLQAGADRGWFGAQLYHAGRAPVVILSGGDSGWSDADEPEANGIQAFERDLGVPQSALLIEARSRNTEENALFTKQLMVEHHLSTALLVTSALHMPRAFALFRAQGIDVIAAPTDIEAIPPQSALKNWLPDTETLDRSGKAIKEYLGLAVLRFRGIVG